MRFSQFYRDGDLYRLGTNGAFSSGENRWQACQYRKQYTELGIRRFAFSERIAVGVSYKTVVQQTSKRFVTMYDQILIISTGLRH